MRALAQDVTQGIKENEGEVEGEAGQRGTHVGIFQIRKLRVDFDFFLCLYPLIQFFPKYSDTLLTLVTSSPLLTLVTYCMRSIPHRGSLTHGFTIPRSLLHLLLVTLLHHMEFASFCPQWHPVIYASTVQ